MDLGLAVEAEAVEPRARQMERKLKSCMLIVGLVAWWLGGGCGRGIEEP